MQEYVSEAVVLHQEYNGDLDSRCAIFTKHFGKISGKVKSVRRITSKLAGHLQPGNRVTVRFVETGGLQLVDALKEAKQNLTPADLYFLDRLLAEGEPDFALWQELTAAKFDWRRVLKILGWDPSQAECSSGRSCLSGGQDQPPAAFSPANQEFFCELCASKIKPNELIYLP